MIDHLVRNEEAFATGVGMGDHHRVHRASHARQLFLGGRLATVENTRAAAEQGVEGPLPFPHPLQSIGQQRSEEHTSELQTLMRNPYAVFCLKKAKTDTNTTN